MLGSSDMFLAGGGTGQHYGGGLTPSGTPFHQLSHPAQAAAVSGSYRGSFAKHASLF
jgi:hypothetical protein